MGSITCRGDHTQGLMKNEKKKILNTHLIFYHIQIIIYKLTKGFFKDACRDILFTSHVHGENLYRMISHIFNIKYGSPSSTYLKYFILDQN